MSFALTRVYTESFNKSPATTLAFVGGSLNAVGDSVAQLYQNSASPHLRIYRLFLQLTLLQYGRKEHERPAPYDFARTFRFFCFGVGMSPLIGRWNAFLEQRFPLRTSGGSVSLKALLKRVASDQLFMAPIGLTLFLGTMGVMEGRNTRQIRQKYSDLFAPALITNWQVWPMVQLVNFRYMPLPYRVPFQTTCGVFWTLYLSILNSREDQKQDYQTDLRKTIRPQSDQAIPS